MRRLFLAVLFGLSLETASAQQVLPVSPEVVKAYNKGTRDISGQPGKQYWQNRADYSIKLDFDPQTRLVSGEVQIKYVNNSPDTLEELWFKLYPNLYQKGIKGKSRIAEADRHDGVAIAAFKVADKELQTSDYTIDGTNMRASITKLTPGKSLNISLKYSYTLNKGSHVRTGQVDDGAFFIAYFFPRIAVYDDLDGWNKLPYTGEEEFYNDFGDFKVDITVPGKYMVWATGDLKNADKVLNKTIAARLKLAEIADSVVNVITPEDLARAAVTKPGRNSFHYEASYVPDFAFALSNHYLWKSSSVVVDSITSRRSRVDAVFNAEHKDYFEVVNFARTAVHAMSHLFPKWPYPYSHETIFDGLDQMEYPMMVNDNPVKDRDDAITLTVHEIFHTMFPFYMGTNETKHAWMDEGWATIGEWLLGPVIEPKMVDTYGVEPTANTSGRKDDTPIVTLTPDLSGVGTFTNSYPKPAMGYLYIRDYLGEALFTKALHHYIKNWNGKHPMPQDFFNSMNAGAGKDMNWFWKRWFYEDGITDMGITAVAKASDGYVVTVQNKSIKPLPVDLTLTFTDGSTEELHRTIGVWESGVSELKLEIRTRKTLKRVLLGAAHTPDKNKNDNVFNL